MSTTINAVADFRGTFKQEDTSDLLLKVTDFDGRPVDPSYLTCTIQGPTENASLETVSTGVPFQITQGFYVFSWKIGNTQDIGTYNVNWEYVVNSETKHEYQSIVVVEKVEAPTFYMSRVLAFRAALEYHIMCAQNIPVYSEQSKPSRDKRKFEFSFPRWNQSAGVKIYRNQELVNEGMEVNYFKGNITFDDTLLEQDVVNADYNFKWFSDDDLNRFLGNAVQSVNLFPPVSGYYLEDIPDRFIPIVLYGGAKDALRQLMMCLQFQQPAQIFGGVDESQKAFSNFQSLKEDYEKDWEKLLEVKKYGPYPRLQMNVVPEYTLPGGRSRWFRYLFK